MDTLLLYLTDTLPQRALMGLRFEGVRYAIGTLGVFFTIWILLAPFLQGRRIRQAMPRKKQMSQIKTELFNSLRTICVFIALDIIIFDLAQVGIFKTYTRVSDYGWLWFAASIPLGIVLHDA